MADSIGPDGPPVAIPTPTDPATDPWTDAWAEQLGPFVAHMVPWLVVVVRSWAHGDRVVVRMTMSRASQPPVVCYEPSGPDAGRRLTHWLEQTDPPDVPPAPNPARDEPETTW